jgi:hypothetical protein
VAAGRPARHRGSMASRGLTIAAVLVAGALLGGGVQVAEGVFGLPNAPTALGAPWLVAAFAVGALIRSRVTAGLAGALLLGTGTGLYYAAIVVAYGRSSADYATVMAAMWGCAAGVAGAGMALTGCAWRSASGIRAALLAAVAGATLAAELACGIAVLLLLSWRRAPLGQVLASAVALSLAFAVVEAEVRDFMRAAGWHGA